MSTVASVVSAIAEKTRPENAPAWDPVGLQLGDPEMPVGSVAVCHEVTEEVVAVLEERPVDLLVTYHPLLFEPTNRLLGGRSAGARAYRLVRAGVALAVTHTDFDAMPGGTADTLLALVWTQYQYFVFPMIFGVLGVKLLLDDWHHARGAGASAPKDTSDSSGPELVAAE